MPGGYAQEVGAGGYSYPGAASGGGGGGVTGSSDSSLSIAGADAIINRATAGSWTAAQAFTAAAVPVTATITDASAATQLEAARLRHLSSVAGTAGSGAYVSLWGTNSASAAGEAARVLGMLRTVTAGSETGAIVFQVNNAGVMTNQGFSTGSFMYGTGLAIGTISATGTIVTSASFSSSGGFITCNNGSSSNGGWTFTSSTNVSGARPFFVLTPSSNSGITAATEVKFFEYQTHTSTWASNTAISSQREFSIAAPTLAFTTSGGVISDAATFYVSGAPIAGTNATLTRSYSIWTDDGDVRHDNIGVALGGGAVPTLGTIGGSGPATAAQNKWARLNIDGTNYFIPVWV